MKHDVTRCVYIGFFIVKKLKVKYMTKLKQLVYDEVRKMMDESLKAHGFNPSWDNDELLGHWDMPDHINVEITFDLGEFYMEIWADQWQRSVYPTVLSGEDLKDMLLEDDKSNQEWFDEVAGKAIELYEDYIKGLSDRENEYWNQ